MSFASYLPPFEGLLPKWLLLVSGISILNALSSFASPRNARMVYPYGTSVTPHTARLFGTWTLYSGIVRGYAAYHLSDPGAYSLAFASFVVALLHFASETLVWRTTGPRSAALSSYIVAAVSTGWMWLAWQEYVER